MPWALLVFFIHSKIFLPLQQKVYFQEMRFEEGLQKFTTALVVLGYNPHLSYNVALCYYRLKEYAPALKHIGKRK